MLFQRKALRDLPCVRACAELVHHCILDVVLSYIHNEWSGRHMASASRIGFIQFFQGNGNDHYAGLV